jgi:hypothetical protein
VPKNKLAFCSSLNFSIAYSLCTEMCVNSNISGKNEFVFWKKNFRMSIRGSGWFSWEEKNRR